MCSIKNCYEKSVRQINDETFCQKHFKSLFIGKDSDDESIIWTCSKIA